MIFRIVPDCIKNGVENIIEKFKDQTEEYENPNQEYQKKEAQRGSKEEYELLVMDQDKGNRESRTVSIEMEWSQETP